MEKRWQPGKSKTVLTMWSHYNIILILVCVLYTCVQTRSLGEEGDVMVNGVKLKKLIKLREILETIKFYFSSKQKNENKSSVPGDDYDVTKQGSSPYGPFNLLTFVEIKLDNILDMIKESTEESLAPILDNIKNKQTTSKLPVKKTLPVTNQLKQNPELKTTLKDDSIQYLNEIQNEYENQIKTSTEMKQSNKILPTLSQASDLFDEFYSNAKYYLWKSQMNLLISVNL
jgi:hypothetical protein